MSKKYNNSQNKILENAEKNYRSGKFEEALELYSHAISLFPNSALAYYNRGVIYALQADYGKAIIDFTQAVSIDTTFLDAYFNRSMSFYRLGQYIDSINDLNLLVVLEPKNSRFLESRGLVNIELKQYSEAVNDFTTSIEIAKHVTPSILMNRGKAYHLMGQYKNAINDYSNAIKLAPRDIRIYRNRAISYLTYGDLSASEEDLTLALKISENNVDLWQRGKIRLELGKIRDALMDYQRVHSSDPDNIELNLDISHAFTLLEDYESAINFYNKAADITSKDYRIFYNRGTTQAKIGNYENALRDLDKAIELNSEDPQIFVNRGIVYFKIEKYDLAFKEYMKALQLDKNLVEAYFNRGTLLLAMNELEDAVNDFLFVSKQRVEIQAQAYYFLAKTFRKLNNIMEAKNALNMAIQLDPTIEKSYINDLDLKDLDL